MRDIVRVRSGRVDAEDGYYQRVSDEYGEKITRLKAMQDRLEAVRPALEALVAHPKEER